MRLLSPPAINSEFFDGTMQIGASKTFLTSGMPILFTSYEGCPHATDPAT